MSKDQNLPDDIEHNDGFHSEDDGEFVNNRGDEENMNEDDTGSLSTRGQLEDMTRQIQLMNSRLDQVERERRALAAENKRLRGKRKSKSSKLTDPMKRVPHAKSGEISSQVKIVPKVASKGETVDEVTNSMRSMLKRAQATGFSVSRKHIRLLNKGTQEQKETLMSELTGFVSSKNTSNVSVPAMISGLRVLSNSDGTKKRPQASNSKTKHDSSKKMKLSNSDVHEGDLSLLADLENNDEEEEIDNSNVDGPDEHYDDFDKHNEDDEDEQGTGAALNVNLNTPLQIPQK